jgi:type I restriction enzyme M protein
LWAATEELRANSKLKSSEYAVPVLELIFLRYADQKFSTAEKQLLGESTGQRKIGPSDYQAKGVLYLPEEARFQTLLNLPEGKNIGKSRGRKPHPRFDEGGLAMEAKAIEVPQDERGGNR